MANEKVTVQREDLERILRVAERPGMTRMTMGEGQARDRLKQALAGKSAQANPQQESGDLIDLFGVPGEALMMAGYETLAQVRAASDEDLLAIDGIGKTTVKKIRAAEGG